MRLLRALVTAYVVTTCALGQSFEEPAAGGEDAALPSATPPSVPGGTHPIDDVLDRSRSRLLTIPGVVGTGHGRTEDGHDAIIVWVTDPTAAGSLPQDLEGFTVIVKTVPDGFHALEG